MTETNESWGKILELIEASLSVPRRIIELIAVKDILTLSASGVANHKIASVLDLDPFYVKSVLIEFIDFSGWAYDLDLNPYSIFINLISKGYTEFTDFKKELFVISPYMNDEILTRNAFQICRRLYDIEREIEKEYK